jgi:hypothetical protein
MNQFTVNACIWSFFDTSPIRATFIVRTNRDEFVKAKKEALSAPLFITALRGETIAQRHSFGAYLAVKVPEVPTIVRAVEVLLVTDWQLQSMEPVALAA